VAQLRRAPVGHGAVILGRLFALAKIVDSLRDLQRDYLTDLRQVIDRMREHGRCLGDQQSFAASFPELLFLAHQLKGSGGSLGFPGITNVARRISDELNLFLDEQQAARPTPEDLSKKLLALSGELEREVATARQTLVVAE
jgi:HPt (histidine-containing phosphotransfer) domain-containing protein